MTDIARLRKALDPFERVLAINQTLHIPAERPLSGCIPGAWPSWGEFQSLIVAARAVLEHF